MADLYEEGYLAQPHTSAGRIPTEKAFKSYVHSLASAACFRPNFERLRTELAESRDDAGSRGAFLAYF